MRRPSAAARRRLRRFWSSWGWRAIQLLVSALVLYGLLPQLVNLWSELPNIKAVGWMGLGLSALLQLGSWWCSSELDRAVLPGTPAFVTFTSSWRDPPVVVHLS